MKMKTSGIVQQYIVVWVATATMPLVYPWDISSKPVIAQQPPSSSSPITPSGSIGDEAYWNRWNQRLSEIRARRERFLEGAVQVRGDAYEEALRGHENDPCYFFHLYYEPSISNFGGSCIPFHAYLTWNINEKWTSPNPVDSQGANYTLEEDYQGALHLWNAAGSVFDLAAPTPQTTADYRNAQN
jgi:hypothetical protein